MESVRASRREPKKLPDVSVIMTALNAERYLAEAIDSIVSQQTKANWELIVVDDGSTDQSYFIACSYARREPGRIRVLTHPGHVNRGISASRNLGLANASGELLAFLDADDVWLPFRLEHQLEIFAGYPQASMIYGQAERWFEFDRPFDAALIANGQNYIPPLIPSGAGPGLLQPPTLLEWFLADEALTPCTCTVMVRTEIARRVGGFESAFTGLYDDQVFYAKLALREQIVVDSRCVARYRKHADSCCLMAEKQGVESLIREQFLRWLGEYSGERRGALLGEDRP